MNLITIGIITTAVMLIALVLIQDRSSGVGGAFGGGEGSVYQTRRGVEKFIFIATIVLLTVFLGLSIFNIYQREHMAAVSSAATPTVQAGDIKATDANGNPVDIKITPAPTTPAIPADKK